VLDYLGEPSAITGSKRDTEDLELRHIRIEAEVREKRRFYFAGFEDGGRTMNQ
jgi:hypothetical protein